MRQEFITFNNIQIEKQYVKRKCITQGEKICFVNHIDILLLFYEKSLLFIYFLIIYRTSVLAIRKMRKVALLALRAVLLSFAFSAF